MVLTKMLAFGSLGLGALAAATLYYQSSAHIEIPAYVVEISDGDFEVRTYPEQNLAQVMRTGSRRTAVQSAFSPLARYIFARNRPGERIAMTAPVLQEPQADGWVVSFIMPAGIMLDDLPTPTGEVRLTTEPARRMAALRFSGAWTDARFDAATERLLDWVSAQGLEPAGPPAFGYYDDPFKPAFMRRNEVLMPVIS